MKKAPRRTGASRMSLREMPEVDLKDGRWRPNEYTARIAQGSHVAEARQAEEGRGESGPSVIRSVRFPTDLQGQHLAFIYAYSKIHRVPPAEADFQHFFEVSPPSVHRMVVELERKRLIRRQPGRARSIELLVPPEALPILR